MRRKIKQLVFVVFFSCSSLFALYNYTYKDFKPYKCIPVDEDSAAETLQRFDKNLIFVENNVRTCELKSSNNSEPRLVINLVVSARGNFENRQAVRDTWGSRKKYGEWTFRVLFLLGLPSPSTLGSPEAKEKLMSEIKQHRDIIVGNFEDTYHNLNYKHLLGYKWMLEYCEWADIVVKNDDDVFLNAFQLATYLSENKYSSAIHCWETKRAAPRRTGNDKWKVSVKYYPFDVYPDYCTGAGYIITPGSMKKIYEVRALFKNFWIDDVFVTGLLRSHPKVVGDVKLKNIGNRFTYYSNDTEKNWNDDWLFVILPRKQTSIEDNFYRLWRRVTLINGGSTLRQLRGCDLLWTTFVMIFGASISSL